MISASKAKLIGDKLYQLERIHSKIVTFTHNQSNRFGSNSNQKESFKEFIQELKSLIECMSEDINGKYISNYLNAINQVNSKLDLAKSLLDMDLFHSCCYLHGTYAKFRRKVKKIISRGCEINYQKVCTPLLLVELERKQLKKSSEQKL